MSDKKNNSFRQFEWVGVAVPKPKPKMIRISDRIRRLERDPVRKAALDRARKSLAKVIAELEGL